ncbi:DNA-binding transcriptional LysR family regulator [Tamaricihabitans halophyticus]|uniref:DNA-binding transcriptional LysR family regulator n=1 Tax=Tamaricihabitans halophyticus TaxID=1262583 RepID=A0A4R2QQ50_9PSEU|nr:LysR family transcriptional regulator [Tamaricihabitans halophyticus]TCP50788.1 DNA-binding transcriptional LysR family regulator [Tamaricihabitans halophyticus]
MERKQLEYFLAIAAHGSFTSAAAALRVAQPSLSYVIRTLEREIGAQLFRRLGRGVVLTHAGTELLAPARQVLSDFAQLRTVAQRVVGLVSGRLDVIAETTLAVEPLPTLVGAFRRQHPGVEIHVADPENPAAVIDGVRRGQCELGLTERGVNTAGLATYDLPEQEVLAVLPPSAPRPENGVLSVAALAELDLVTTPPGTTTRSHVDEVLATVGARARIAVETTQRAALVPMVLAGAGATLLPRSLAVEAESGGGIVAALDPPARRRGVLVHAPPPLSPAALAFVEMLRTWQPAPNGVLETPSN